MNIIIKTTFVLLALLSSHSFAKTTESFQQDRLVNQGKAFFENKQYPKAIEIYENLINDNNSSNEIQYNLAVAYYKNSQYTKSKKLFSTLSASPSFSSVAFLNLGLISAKENKLVTARMYFEKSIESDNTGKTSALSKTMLLRLDKEKIKKPTAKRKTWLNITSLNIGAENRTLDPASNNISAFANKNRFFSFSAYAAKDIFVRHAKKLNLSFNTFYKKNTPNSDFDFLLLSSALTKPFRTKKWQVSPSISTNYMTLGGKPFESTIDGDIRFKRKIFKQHNIQIQNKLAFVNGIGDEYAPFDGVQYKFRFQSQFIFSPIRVTPYFEFEKNNRKNKINKNNQFDYSPTRTKFSLNLETKPMLSLKPKIEISYRQSEYRIIDRLDKLWKMRARISYIFSRKTSLFFNVELTKNNSNSNTDSNPKRYSYTRSLFLFGAKYLTW